MSDILLSIFVCFCFVFFQYIINVFFPLFETQEHVTLISGLLFVIYFDTSAVLLKIFFVCVLHIL